MSASTSSEHPEPSGGAAAEARREITAVSIPGRFLPELAAPAAGRLPLEPDETSREVAAAVHRLVASTDDAARGLTGFCWDHEDEPVSPQSPSAAGQAPPAVTILEESTPLPLPMLPAAAFWVEPAAPEPGGGTMAPSEVAALPTEAEPLPIAAASLSLKATPPPESFVSGSDEPEWNPVGFPAALIGISAESPDVGTTAARSHVAPLSAVASEQPEAATVAAQPSSVATTTPPPESRPLSLGVPWVLGVRRLRHAAAGLAGTGWARLRTGSLRLRIFREKARKAAAHRKLSLSWPVELRISFPWFVAVGATLGLLAILLTAHSCAVRAKAKGALPRAQAATPQSDPAPVSPDEDDALPQDPR